LIRQENPFTNQKATAYPGGFFHDPQRRRDGAMKEKSMAKKSSGLVGYAAESAKWQVESDLRTLQEAEAIEKDPKRFKAAQDLAKKKLIELAAVVSEKPGD
jgi:uncharacterized protein (DUF2461 family)